MRTTIKKWGNSAAIRIPHQLMRTAKLRIGQAVHIHVQRGALVIEPVTPAYSLTELVNGITPENRHEAIEWSGPVGKEVW